MIFFDCCPVALVLRLIAAACSVSGWLVFSGSFPVAFGSSVFYLFY
jgi:hypothetical protein